MELTAAAKAFVTEHGYDPVYGARPLKRFLQKHVETLSAKLILSGDVGMGDTIVIDVDGDHLKAFVKTEEIDVAKNYLYSALAGFLWFVNFIFYGMGKSRMGEFSFTAWGILMSLTIVFATLWGLYRGEWKATDGKTKGWMSAGLVVLVVASFIIGMSGGA